MKPYYSEAGVTIYCADSREYFCDLGYLPGESVITDPVWPNSAFPDVQDPQGLLASVLQWADERTRRVVIHLGCNSDPRFLAAVPSKYLFFRSCWLEYACPNYIGRLLYTGDMAYAFGEPPPSRPGAHVIPGRIVATKNDKGFARGNGRNKTGAEFRKPSAPDTA